MKVPVPPEPLEVQGIRIPWDTDRGGWVFKVLGKTVGIERYCYRGEVPCYRYLRLSGGPWTTSDNLDFSIKAMEEELDQLSRNEVLVSLIQATREKIEKSFKSK